MWLSSIYSERNMGQTLFLTQSSTRQKQQNRLLDTKIPNKKTPDSPQKKRPPEGGLSLLRG